MFAFKARSISEFIADPIASSTSIPVDSVIFVMGYQSTTNYNGISNWELINASQAGDYPSYIRGTSNISRTGSLFTKSITDSISLTSSGTHSGIEGGQYRQPRNDGATPLGGAYTNDAAGSHAHAISGLSGSNYLGGFYFAGTVVRMWRCITSTKEIPANTLSLMSDSPLNDDFSTLSSDSDNTCLLSGSGSWTIINGPTYGSASYSSSFNILTTSAGDHNHYLTSVYPIYRRISGTVRTPDVTSLNSIGNHNHYASLSVNVNPSVIYQKAYYSKRATGVHRGMILGWLGTNTATLPTGWYLCNGQTINGFTTPTLNVDRFIKLTNDSNKNGLTEGNDLGVITSLSTSSGTTSSQHSHGPVGDDYRNYDTVYSAYHRTFDWTHSHTNSSSIINYRQGYYALNFIIYLG